jgi:hypothetical protein
MSRGPVLTITELKHAEHMYDLGYTWREVGKLMNRDFSGLSKRIQKSRTQPVAQLMAWRGKRRLKSYPQPTSVIPKNAVL